MKAIVTSDNNGLIAEVDGLLHLQIIKGHCIAVHSYIDKVKDEFGIKYNMYYINFHLASGQTVKCEYNRRDLWEQILKGL